MSDAAVTEVRPLEALIGPAMRWDPSGRSWLPALLEATPHARERLGELTEHPGSISMTLSVRAVSGRLGCFEYPAAPPRELLAWFIDHPEALTEHADEAAAAETRRLRGCLFADDPPGSRVRAQERAREQLPVGSPFGTAWWRFEDAATPECVLMTDRLVLTVQSDGTDPLAPATPWYPARTRLVRDLEAARGLAAGRRHASLLIAAGPHLRDAGFARLLKDGTPHLGEQVRRELGDAFLGCVAWSAAERALAPPGARG